MSTSWNAVVRRSFFLCFRGSPGESSLDPFAPAQSKHTMLFSVSLGKRWGVLQMSRAFLIHQVSFLSLFILLSSVFCLIVCFFFHLSILVLFLSSLFCCVSSVPFLLHYGFVVCSCGSVLLRVSSFVRVSSGFCIITSRSFVFNLALVV